MDVPRPSERPLIGRAFFRRSPLVCARELIGAELRFSGCAGIVVETEAYDAEGDAACHTFFRPSARAFVEQHEAGAAYIYLNYGMHWLLNVLVKGRRSGFVLFRAVEPTTGLDQMAARRKTSLLRKLCAGPGRMTQAFGIDGRLHGSDLCGEGLVTFYERYGQPKVIADGRIGISLAGELPWRFVLEESPFVSVPARRNPALPGAKRPG